jgi:hypothetical protein
MYEDPRNEHRNDRPQYGYCHFQYGRNPYGNRPSFSPMDFAPGATFPMTDALRFGQAFSGFVFQTEGDSNQIALECRHPDRRDSKHRIIPMTVGEANALFGGDVKIVVGD